MSKEIFTRDEVKALLREAIQRKRNDAEPVVEDKPETKPDEQKTYTREEVEAIIRKDREARSKQ